MAHKCEHFDSIKENGISLEQRDAKNVKRKERIR